MPHLIVLIGLPGSGKSSLANQLVRECPLRSLISTDQIRSDLFGDAALQGAWQKVQREVARQFCQAALQIQTGTMIEAIYDATNVRRRQRRQMIALAYDCGFTAITGVWLNLPLEVCLSRNQRRDRQVPEAVILQMYRRMQGAPPSCQEGMGWLLELHQ